jgi:hypothetical protein
MSKKTYGSANAAREAWVEPGDLARKIANIGGKKRKARKIRTTGDAAPKATRKSKATENRPEVPTTQPVATGATTGDAVPVLAQAAEAVPAVTPKPGRAPKAKVAPETATATPAPAPGTLAAVAEGYLADIQRNGRSAGTAGSYRADLAVAMKFLGAETPVADLTEARVREFFEDRRVTHTRKGAPKNPVTVAKTRRILRLALVWAAEQGIIPAAPIPTLDEAPTAAEA